MAISIPFEQESQVERLRRAVATQPKSAPARHALAAALDDADDPAEAIEQCCKALTANARHYPSARLLASLLQRFELNDEIEVAERALEAALKFVTVDRQALCAAAINRLKASPEFARACALGDSEDWDAAAVFLLSAAGQNLLKNRLFRSALSLGVNTNIAVEHLLTALRRHLLLFAPADIPRRRAVYEFICAMIQQCINNEYVFVFDDDERRALDRLDTDDASGLMLSALYRPLHEIVPAPFDPDWLDRLTPKALRRLVTDHLAARRTEAEAAEHLGRLTEIADETSKRVQRQYFADPYPKWLSMQTPMPGSAQMALRDFFTASELARLDEPFDVLVAGCGTGRQAIDAALGYGPTGSVMAVDLSAPSLAYGLRMAPVFGAANLHFAQADILELDRIERQFEVIECVGVLHHMARPYTAWRILVDRLRPGGFMQIGLYSGVSRSGIMALRDDPACPGPEADDDALRAFRAALMRRKAGEPGFDLTISQDFFIKSSFRDLALHVSEQHCTIPEISEFLAANGLRFHGFQLPQLTLDSFAAAFPGDDPPGTLDHWRRFESENPRSFDGMYVFWCRKQ